MQVKVENIEVKLGNNGIVLRIADNAGKHVGKLRVGQATVEWCPGKVSIGNGTKIRMRDFVSMLNSQ